ncbi:hypothetical protein AU467_31405 [Mesorhizobium loti]|uniref:Uncharacterized protein n=1 Tax=Rhizobium loti TaxID=381 RepID=A0A117N1W1_RHILI|nr:hypothetical protein AU467_31405 [Mesorhizobium loti]
MGRLLYDKFDLSPFFSSKPGGGPFAALPDECAAIHNLSVADASGKDLVGRVPIFLSGHAGRYVG